MHEDAGQRRRRRMLLLRQSAGAQVAEPVAQVAEVPASQPSEEPVSLPPNEFLSVEDELFTACQANGEVTICVEDLARRLLREQFLDRPVLTIGQGPENDLWLSHERILPRHALLAWFNGSVFFMTLSSKAELLGAKGQVSSGWWTPNLCLRVGAFRLRLQGIRKTPPDFDPLSIAPSLETELPRLELHFLGSASPKHPWPVNRPLTLVGRSSVCKIRLDHPQILPVQAALIRTAGRLWLVNLGTPEHAQVNDRPVASAALDVGDVLRFGSFKIEVQAAAEWPQRADAPIVETPSAASANATPDVSALIRHLADQHQKLLESHLQTLRDLERLAERTTDAHQLRAIQDLIQKTFLATDANSGFMPAITLPGRNEHA